MPHVRTNMFTSLTVGQIQRWFQTVDFLAEERYAIMKQVEADSLRKVKMGPGTCYRTLYGALGRIMETRLIPECDKNVEPKMEDDFDDQQIVGAVVFHFGVSDLTSRAFAYTFFIMLGGREMFASYRFGPQR